MNLYRIISDGILSHKEKVGQIDSIHLNDPVVQVQIEKKEVPVGEAVPVTNHFVLDTDDSVMIAKYKENLQTLVSDALQRGYIDEFRIIREDDCFPYNWVWRVNSSQTAREYAKSTLAYSLRMAEARKRVDSKKTSENLSFGFDFPGSADEENKEASLLGPHFGQIYEPTKFRSTKHFTINTPLLYTGSYNQVSSGRNYIVIDKPASFCKSGYGYSADYQDAYLDVTHEPLAISDDALVLIEESKYPEIIKDDEIREQLKERKVVLYRGDEATAINMVLAQEGVLPYRIGGKYMEFNSKLEEIMVQSMKDFCNKNDLEYSHNHGNMFGKGGHFSDLLDSDEYSRKDFEKEFISFLQKSLPEYEGLINSMFYQFPDKIVRSIDHSKVLGAIEQYNVWAHQDEIRQRREYDYERSTITPKIHELFVETIHLIRDYFATHPSVEDENLYQAILTFFHNPYVEQQEDAANRIKQILLKETKQY